MMKRLYYDFHIHSCLSPCADNDSTPNNIAGMAKLCGLDIIALTDHNSCKNCPAFFKVADRYGIIPVPGMELTTSEDIHVICLFETLENAMRFDDEIQKHRTLIPNRVDIFGNQFILDGDDNIIGEEEHYLTNATDISVESAPSIVGSFGGVCYPAHIDRPSNGIIAVLGTFPPDSAFKSYEINNKENAELFADKYSLNDKHLIISSDAHNLTDFRDREFFFEIEDGSFSESQIRHKILDMLK